MQTPPKNRLVAAFLTLMIAATLSMWWQYPIHKDQLEPSNLTLEIDLNTASAAQLQLLPGIGAVLAKLIVTEREIHGPYTSLKDLQRVPGIGETLPPQIAPFIQNPINPDEPL